VKKTWTSKKKPSASLKLKVSTIPLVRLRVPYHVRG
jgi:hypothetical protein